MLRSSFFLVLCTLLISSASAGLTVVDQLEAVFTSNTISASTYGQMSGSTQESNFPSPFTAYSGKALIGTGDILEIVSAFSASDNSAYAALIWRAKIDSADDPFHLSATANQENATVLSSANQFGQLPTSALDLTTGVASGSGLNISGNHFAYLVTSETYNFANKTFAQIEANKAVVNVIASYGLTSNLVINSSLDKSGGVMEATYSYSLTQLDIVLDAASLFSTVDGTSSVLAASSVGSGGKLVSYNFDVDDTTHTFGPSGSSPSVNQLTFASSLAVPEPSSVATLSLLGCLGIMVGRRRK
jgi:hypothetical protein